MKPDILKLVASHSIGDDCFFTSDLHFGHYAMACKFRNFKSVDDMNDCIIENINAVVTNEHRLFICGDLSVGISNKALIKLISALKGKKYLIFGNHDHKMNQEVADCFELVTPLLQATIPKTEFEDDKQGTCVMSHCPLATWNRMYRGSWLLHGHSHGQLKIDLGKALDIGIDCHKEFRPFSYQTVKAYMNGKEIAYHGLRTWGEAVKDAD